MKILQFTKFKLIEFINKFRRLTEVLSNKIRSQNK
jgi:hypothetical protein